MFGSDWSIKKRNIYDIPYAVYGIWSGSHIYLLPRGYCTSIQQVYHTTLPTYRQKLCNGTQMYEMA